MVFGTFDRFVDAAARTCGTSIPSVGLDCQNSKVSAKAGEAATAPIYLTVETRKPPEATGRYNHASSKADQTPFQTATIRRKLRSILIGQVIPTL